MNYILDMPTLAGGLGGLGGLNSTGLGLSSY